MEEIHITLETLYDILRNEKKREDLQKLNDSFFLDIVSYLREKKSFLDASNNGDNPFASGEKEKLEYELRSIKRILKEIYEKREKKIIDIALNKSRTASDIIDISAMLREEKEFYQRILTILDGFRRGVLLNLFNHQLPDLLEAHIQRPHLEDKKKEPKNEDADTPMTKIKFLYAVPSFVWKDLKVYGPFDIGEETHIFPEVADLMVRKGRAVKV